MGIRVIPGNINPDGDNFFSRKMKYLRSICKIMAAGFHKSKSLSTQKDEDDKISDVETKTEKMTLRDMSNISIGSPERFRHSAILEKNKLETEVNIIKLKKKIESDKLKAFDEFLEMIANYRMYRMGGMQLYRSYSDVAFANMCIMLNVKQSDEEELKAEIIARWA